MAGLSSLRPLKEKNPDLVINLMGCLVGCAVTTISKSVSLMSMFSPHLPTLPHWSLSLPRQKCVRWKINATQQRFALMDGDLVLPEEERDQSGCRLYPDRIRLFARLHLLHHPLPARGRTQPPAGRNSERGARAGRSGRKRNHPARSNRRPLWQRTAGISNPGGPAGADACH